MRKNLKQVLKAGGRAKELVQQILTYSRQREREMRPVKINLIVNEALKLLRASLPSTIQINNNISSNRTIMSDSTNIHQVIMNLCTNAGHAMQESGGLLEVSLADVDIDADFVKNHPGLIPGKFVRLTVSDTGHGMSPEVIERIFDPFFSTKRKGDGTGMGLSVVHGIVKSHGGTLTVESAPGRGAVFNHEAGHELDASIMDGRTLECGAVTGVTTVKNPIGLARRVMERTDHVLLSGAGAERFADEMGVDRVDPTYFSTERRRRQLERKQVESAARREHGTVGVVALDRHGDLAAGTSTGGLTDKLYGRVGDTPIVGAGTFADNASCAVSATGRGEEFIRHGVALTVCRIVQREGKTLEAAAREVIHEVLEPGDGGIIAVDAGGRLALEFNTEGMYRGSADSSGRFDVEIWR